jgi:hypothetical protein
MRKGAPSVNPEGPRIAKRSTAAPGFDGVVAYGGFLDHNEADSDLRGDRRWTTFANMYRRPPVAIWGRLRASLLAGVTWTAVENEAGGADATRGKDLVDQGLLKAKFSTGVAAKPFSAIAAKAMNGAAAVGHSVHATALGRRKDGTIVYTDIAHRPQHTIFRWLREVEADEASPFVGIVQRTKQGQSINISLDECLYVVNDNGTQSDSPAGVGMLELIAERVRRLGVYEPLEGSELASSMGGLPIIRSPLQEIVAEAEKRFGKGAEAVTKIASAVSDATSAFKKFVANRFKDPSKLAWFLLDSMTYQGSDPNTISGIQKWGIEIVKGDMQGLAEMRKIISDYDLDIARMLGVEHVFMGGGDTTGTYGAHESKISALGSALNAEVGLFAFVSAMQLARRLCIANGLDPDTSCPTLVPSPIMRTDVARAVDAIVKLNMAQLPKNHPAKKAVFEEVDLPWQEEDESEEMAPRALPFGFGRPKADPTAEPKADPKADPTKPDEQPADEVDANTSEEPAE